MLSAHGRQHFFFCIQNNFRQGMDPFIAHTGCRSGNRESIFGTAQIIRNTHGNTPDAQFIFFIIQRITFFPYLFNFLQELGIINYSMRC